MDLNSILRLSSSGSGRRPGGPAAAAATPAEAAEARARALASLLGGVCGAGAGGAPAPSALPQRPAHTPAATSLASSAATTRAAAGRPLSQPLPPLCSFSSPAAALAALARHVNALADESQAVRREALSRLSVCLCGVDWLDDAQNASLEDGSTPSASGQEASGAPPAPLRATSHRATEGSAALALAAALPTASTVSDPAYANYAHEISEVAALLTGKGAGGVWGRAPGDAAAERLEAALGGGACELVELSSLTRAVAACLTHASRCIEVGAAPVGGGLPAQPPQQRSADSDDEDEGGDGTLPAVGAAAAAALPVSAVAPSAAALQRTREALLRELWVPHLMRPVLMRWSDPCEAMRLGALRLTACLLPCLTELTPTLPFLMPALVDRVNRGAGWVFDPEQRLFAKGAAALAAHRMGRVLPGSQCTQSILASEERDLGVTRLAEGSEVARAAALACMHALLRAAAGSGGGLRALEPHASDLLLCAHALAVDPAPNVRVMAVPVLVQLVNLLPHITKVYASGFVRSLMAGGLDHRHAKVRLATLDAVDAMVHCPDEAKQRGAGSEAVLYLLGGREANVLPIASFYGRDVSHNYAAKLALEGNGAVRGRWVVALGGWVNRLPDRMDWWPFLTPYLLSEVAGGGGEGGDQAGGAAAAAPSAPLQALGFLDAAGAAYEMEHAKDLLERLQYGLEGDPSVDYGSGPLPAPFGAGSGRPRVGARLFVRANTRRVLRPLIGELASWTPFGTQDASGLGTRARAAALLAVLLVYYEEAATGDAGALTAACAQCIEVAEGGGGGEVGGGGAAVQPAIRASARLLGRFVPPATVVALLAGLLDEECGRALAGGGGGSSSSSSAGGSSSKCSSGGTGLGVLHVMALALGEVLVTPSRLADATVEALVAALEGVAEKAASKVSLGRALGDEGSGAHALRMVWLSVVEGGLVVGEGAEECLLPQALQPHKQPAPAAAPIPPSISAALQRLRAAKAVGGSAGAAGGGTASMLAAGASSAAAAAAAAATTAATAAAAALATTLAPFRARLLACALLAATLLPQRTDPVTVLTPRLLRLLLALRGALQVEAAVPHWQPAEHTPCPAALAAALASRCPADYQAALAALLPQLATRRPIAALGERSEDIYRPCPWSGLTGSSAGAGALPLPLGVLCDLALLALAQTSTLSGAAGSSSSSSSSATMPAAAGALPPAVGGLRHGARPMPFPPAALALILRHGPRGGAAAPTPLPLVAQSPCQVQVTIALAAAALQAGAAGCGLAKCVAVHLAALAPVASLTPQAVLHAHVTLPLALCLAQEGAPASQEGGAAQWQALQAALPIAARLLAAPTPLLAPSLLALHCLMLGSSSSSLASKTSTPLPPPTAHLLARLLMQGMGVCSSSSTTTASPMLSLHTPSPALTASLHPLVKLVRVLARAAQVLAASGFAGGAAATAADAALAPQEPMPTPADLMLGLLGAWHALERLGVVEVAAPVAAGAVEVGAGAGEAGADGEEEEEEEEEVISFTGTPTVGQEVLGAAMAISAVDVGACAAALAQAPPVSQGCHLGQRLQEHLELLQLLQARRKQGAP